MPVVHISARRFASRALGAARLLAGATTESERVAAQGLLNVLATQGVVAERVRIPGPPEMRMSNDGMLLVGADIFHPSLLLVCLLQSIGFELEGRAFESGADGWYAWVVGPPAKVLEGRLLFATATFLCWAQREVDDNLQTSAHRDAMMLGVVVGIIGHFGQEAKRGEEKDALVLWAEPPSRPVLDDPLEVPVDGADGAPKEKPLAEGAAALRKLDFVKSFLQDWVEAGEMIGRVLGKLRARPAPKRRWHEDPRLGVPIQMRDYFRAAAAAAPITFTNKLRGRWVPFR